MPVKYLPPFVHSHDKKIIKPNELLTTTTRKITTVTLTTKTITEASNSNDTISTDETVTKSACDVRCDILLNNFLILDKKKLLNDLFLAHLTRKKFKFIKFPLK